MKKKKLKLREWVKILLIIIILLIIYKPIKDITINTIRETEQRQRAKEQAQQERINKLLKNQHFNINK